MDRQQFTTMVHKFQFVLDEEVLNERGQALGLLNRFAVEDSRRYEHFGANQQTS